MNVYVQNQVSEAARVLQHLIQNVLAGLGVLAIIVVVQSSVHAATSGKISGQVRDVATGTPLVGATIRIERTSLATETDEDGEFFLIQVPVGKYEVLVSHIGYTSKSQMDVRVLVDLTTPVSVDLEATTTELKQTQRVTAVIPKIQSDLTSSRETFTAERIRDLPNATSVAQILARYPGVVQDADRLLHIRGGRSGQVNYYYDGFSVQDPFVSTSGIRINPQSLEELSLTSGGFTAEYGDALSGILNAVTREGGSNYRGSFRTYSGFTRKYSVAETKWGPLTSSGARSATFDASGPLFGLNGEQYNFFVAGEAYRDRGSLPNDGVTSYSGTVKTTLKPSQRLKFLSNMTYYSADGLIYDHRDGNGVSFSFNLDGLPAFEQRAYLAGFSGQYLLSKRAILDFSVSRFHTRNLVSPPHLMGVHWSRWPGYSEDSSGRYNGTIHQNNYGNNLDFSDPYEATGFAMGDRYDPVYGYREATNSGITASLVNQLTNQWMLKTGIDIKRSHVFRDARQFYNNNPYIEEYEADPWSFAWYGEQKLELDYLVMNLGLRFEHKSIDINYNANPLGEYALKSADATTRWSPRLGMSFPITQDAVLHFNYGHYYEIPIYQALYFNLEGDITSGVPLIGNPDLSPEKTIMYELGIDQMISNDIKFDITAYFKEMSDLVTVRKIGQIAGSSISRYANGDYGSASGFELSLTKLVGSDFLSGSLAYNYMHARGIGSTPSEAYQTYITSTTDTLAPVSEYPLDFDQRHTLTILADYKIPKNWSGSVAGIPIPSGWGLSTAVSVGSGFPYTKTDQSGNRLGEINSGRLPATFSIDTRLAKQFSFGSTNLDLFVEVDNLLDRRNVLNVYTRTGLPTDDNQIVGGGLALDEKELETANRQYDFNPQNFSPPRTVRLGLQLSF